MSLAVRVPATTANLGPGFDALGAALSRHLVVGVVPFEGTRVTTRGEGAGELADDDSNLVWSSLAAFCARYDQPVPDHLALVVDNDVPLERGLGSSSAAIVAGLALGRALTGAPVGDRELVAVATAIEGHPDNVAPAVLGGFVTCATDDAGGLVLRRAQPAPNLRPVVAVPTVRQNTSAARGVLPDTLDRAEIATQGARAAHVVGAILGAWPAEPRLAGDLLHEPARFAVMPATADVVTAWRGAGHHAWLSGAGPSAAAAVPWSLDVAELAALAQPHGFAVEALAWDLAGTVVCRDAGADGGCPVSGVGGCATCPHRRL